MTERLKGRIAIVSGAGCVGPGWGNGRAMAVRFAEEGAKIFATDISADAMSETVERVKAVGGQIETLICNATDQTDVQQMVDACLEHYGGVDILVNNVGGSAKGGPVELDQETWDRQIKSNLTSVYLSTRCVLPHMVAQKRGAIVNMASTSGIRWTGSAQSAYAATKAGVIQFSRVTAIQYAPHNVRVNTIVPGQLHTPMVEARLAGQRTGGDVEKLLADRLSRIPLGFMGDGRDTANAALFLASDEARWITGTEIVIDGGMSVRCD